jgi:hypothetical protein
VLADAGYWHQRQMQQIASEGIQVLVAPDAGLRRGPRPGWTGGMYSDLRFAWKAAARCSLLPCHGCGSAAGADRAPPDAWSSSGAGAPPTGARALVSLRKRPPGARRRLLAALTDAGRIGPLPQATSRGARGEPTGCSFVTQRDLTAARRP